MHALVHHGYFLVPQLVLENTFARDVHVCVGDALCCTHRSVDAAVDAAKVVAADAAACQDAAEEAEESIEMVVLALHMSVG